MKLTKNIIVFATFLFLLAAALNDLGYYVKDGVEFGINLANIPSFIWLEEALVFYTFFFFTNKKILYYIFSALMLILYFLTTLTIYKFYLADSTARIGIGLYFYSISIIMFLSSFFIKKEINKPQKNVQKEIISDNIDVQKEYLLSTYIYGFESNENISKKMCAVIKEESNILRFVITNKEKVIEFIVNPNEIETITISKRILMNQKEVKHEDNSIENMMLAQFLLGTTGPLVSQLPMFQQMQNYTKYSYDSVYEISIVKKAKTNNRTILVYTNNNPSDFFKTFSNVNSTGI